MPIGLPQTVDRVRSPEVPGSTILVVDDEPAIRSSAKLLLETIGFSAVTAGDGQEALEILRNQSSEISAVLLDLTMPQMSGNETLRELRTVSPDLPILVTSGYAGEGSERSFQVNRRTGFIQKPYRAGQLRSKLEELLGARPQPPSGPAASSSGAAGQRE
jgi:CheY-like chemotaxis protein